MPTNNGDATEAHKRRRRAGTTDGTRDGGFAAPPTTDPTSALASTLGPRLAPMLGVSALQPAKLQGTIISSSREMLDLVVNIRQRVDSHARYSRTWTNPKSNQPYTKIDGEPKPYIPNHLRGKHTTKVSALLDDDPDMDKLMREAEAEHEAHQIKMAGISERISSLEIEKRKVKLQTLFFDHAYKFALGLIVIKTVRNGGAIANGKLDRDKLSKKTAYDALKALPPSEAKSAYFSASDLFGDSAEDAMLSSFSRTCEFNNDETEKEMSDEDKTFIQPIVANLSDWLPKTTSIIWNQARQKDEDRQVEAALKLALEPKAIAQATEDVQMALDEESQAKQDATIKAAREAARQETRRLVKEANKSGRKKYSGDAETQASRPEKNGQNSSKKSGKPNARRNNRRNEDSGNDSDSSH